MRAINLQTEYLRNPVGIDVEHPRLFWNCEGGMRQRACRILAVNDRGEELWDTGKVESSRMTHIPYRGKDLKSRDRVLWKVKLWDENDAEGDWSEEAFFEMGLLDPSDWKASWITGDYVPDKKKRYPVDLFKKKFSLDASARVRKARLYVTACGDYEARINGQRAADFVLAPGITDYTVRLQYQTYDVTDLLRAGENELFFSLADGWYRGSVGAWGLTCQYGAETKLLAQMEITLEDGSVQMIGTDSSFLWSNEGPIRFADHKDGEIVDARREAGVFRGDVSPGSDSAGSDSPGSHPLVGASRGGARVTACDVVPTASNNVWIREKERFSPKVITTPAGKTVLDFGRNIAGYIEFTVTAKEGQEVFLRFGEMLDENGEFTQKNIQCSNKKITTPLQQVRYTCKEGENHYKTSFAIFGFQLAELETDVDWKPEDFTAIAVYSDMEQRTFFDSSNELLNRLVESTLWSARNNSADIPTDCPTRERHGWTGDAQIFFNTAAYLLDYAAFARKFEQDLCDWQAKDRKGRFPQIAPAGGVDAYMETMNGSVGWADAGVMIPYRFWKIYGDRKILADNYAAMKKYARFMIKRCGKRGLFAKSLHLSGEARKYAVNIGQSYGEWAEPADVHPNKWTDMIAPHPEVSTAYTVYVMRLMKEIARELGKEKDEKIFAFYEEKVRLAYQALVRTSEYSLDTDRQASLVRPLYFGLLDEEQEQYAKKRLLEALEHYGWRLGTGFLSTPLILDVLQEIDMDAAYRLLENEEMPGWLFMPKSGANTIWESWEGTSAQGGIASLDHYSKGAVCEWLFREMCGIHVAGENHFVIAPKPGGHFTHASAEYYSVYGCVKSEWKRVSEDGEADGETLDRMAVDPAAEKKSYEYHIEIPANTTAEIILPDERKENVTAGVWEF